MVLYDPLFGISFASLTLIVLGLVVTLIVMVKEMPYICKQFQRTVRIKPAGMKYTFTNDKTRISEYK
jgi:hypothetical protein